MKGSRIGEFEELILLAVGILWKEAYGLAIQKHLKEDGHRSANLSAVHASLNRLDAKGYLRSFMSEPTPERGGKRKRLYELTPFGLKALAEIRMIREALWEKLPAKLLNQTAQH